MTGRYFNPRGELSIHGSKLPHWQQENCPVFVTFRLGDSLPSEKLIEWKNLRQRWVLRHPEPWSKAEWTEYHQRFTKEFESWLDKGHGECLLREPDAREIVGNILLKDQGTGVKLFSFVIMPNHVHALFSPLKPIPKVIQIWKGVSARRIGKGSIWMRNYRDTLIRDARHFNRVIHYIRKNPEGLRKDHYTLWESDHPKGFA